MSFHALRGLSRTALLASLVATCALACVRRGESSEQKAQLVGTWHEQGGQDREYALRDDGSFTLRLRPAKCEDAPASTATTVSGTWKVEGGAIVLKVDQANDRLLQGATLTETIAKLEGQALSIQSSISSCYGREVSLTKR